MDIGKSLTFVFEDERWIPKLAIAAGVMLIGIVGAIVIIGPVISTALLMGYMIAIARNVLIGEAKPLPEWRDWGGMFGDGIKYMVVQFLWALPIALVTLPMVFVSAMAEESDAAGGVIAIFAMCIGCLAALYGIILVLAAPVWTLRLAATGRLGDALSPSSVVGFIRENLASVIVVLVVMLIAQLIAGFLGLLICLVGLLVTYPWSYMVQGHLAGQLGRAGGVGGRGDNWPAGADGGGSDWTQPSGEAPAGLAAGVAAGDIPDDSAMVAEVRAEAEGALTGWESQAVRIDEAVGPAVEPAPHPEPTPWAPPAWPASQPEPTPWAPPVEPVAPSVGAPWTPPTEPAAPPVPGGDAVAPDLPAEPPVDGPPEVDDSGLPADGGARPPSGD